MIYIDALSTKRSNPFPKYRPTRVINVFYLYSKTRVIPESTSPPGSIFERLEIIIDNTM